LIISLRCELWLDKKEAARGQKQKKKEKRKEQIVKGRDQGQTQHLRGIMFLAMPVIKLILKPNLSDFLLDLHRSLAHQGFAKILDISTGMPAVFANPYASRSQHISSLNLGEILAKNL